MLGATTSYLDWYQKYYILSLAQSGLGAVEDSIEEVNIKVS